MGSRLDARLLDEQYGYDTSSDDNYYSDSDYSSSSAEYGGGGAIDGSGSLEEGERGSGSSGGGGGGAGEGGSEETKGTLGLTRGPSRQYPKSNKARRPRSGLRGTGSTVRGGRRKRRGRGRARSRSSRQESTRELVDFFADRMQVGVLPSSCCCCCCWCSCFIVAAVGCCRLLLLTLLLLRTPQLGVLIRVRFMVPGTRSLRADVVVVGRLGVASLVFIFSPFSNPSVYEVFTVFGWYT